MSSKSANEQNRVFRALSDAGVVLIQPGFPVERRTILGLHGDDSDLAISLSWRDNSGCEWEADFTEENLKNATIAGNRIMLDDSEGENIWVELFELKPKEL